MSAVFLSDERLVDLLVQQATSGLSPDEATELDALLARYPGARRQAIEHTIAALTLAGRDDGETLPAVLRSRLIATETAMRGHDATVELAARRTERRPARSSAAGWWAAAAALLVAIAGWYPRLSAPPAPRAASELRNELLTTGRNLVHWEFTATAEPVARGASGDVVWDPVTQRGYLRLRGLSVNDASQSQYQLWIFDAARDDRYPVDGGVFDIPAGHAEVVIPIVARLRVARPALFAVTVEKPGGVVVSGREHIAVVAKPSST